jgi:hypothetical protein
MPPLGRRVSITPRPVDAVRVVAAAGPARSPSPWPTSTSRLTSSITPRSPGCHNRRSVNTRSVRKIKIFLQNGPGFTIGAIMMTATAAAASTTPPMARYSPGGCPGSGDTIQPRPLGRRGWLILPALSAEGLSHEVGRHGESAVAAAGPFAGVAAETTSSSRSAPACSVVVPGSWPLQVPPATFPFASVLTSQTISEAGDIGAAGGDVAAVGGLLHRVDRDASRRASMPLPSRLGYQCAIRQSRHCEVPQPILGLGCRGWRSLGRCGAKATAMRRWRNWPPHGIPMSYAGSWSRPHGDGDRAPATGRPSACSAG